MKLKSLFYFAAIVALLSSCAQKQPDKSNFQVYLCLGQSNMAGAAKAEAQDSVVDSRFVMMSTLDCPDLNREKGKWYPAIPPLSDCNAGLSPANYFGITMVENLPKDVKVGVISVAVPGCKIELFDKDDYQAYVDSAPDWMQGWITNYGGNPYSRLVEMARLSQKDGVIKGILLHQGESNPNDTLWTRKVKEIYDNLMDDLNLNPKEVPLLAGETLSEEFDGKCAAFNHYVNQLPEVLPNSYVISSEGCPGQPDGLHFTAEGYRILGKRYGEKMLSVHQNDK